MSDEKVMSGRSLSEMSEKVDEVVDDSTIARLNHHLTGHSDLDCDCDCAEED